MLDNTLLTKGILIFWQNYRQRGSFRQISFGNGSGADIVRYVLSGVPRSFVQVLNAYCDKKKTLN